MLKNCTQTFFSLSKPEALEAKFNRTFEIKPSRQNPKAYIGLKPVKELHYIV